MAVSPFIYTGAKESPNRSSKRNVRGAPNSPPKLGGVPSAARQGGSPAEVLKMRLWNHPACSRRLAGTPPNLGGEFWLLRLCSRHSRIRAGYTTLQEILR